MIELPAYALFLGVAAAGLAVGTAIVLATGQRRRYLLEREQRSRFQLVWKHSTDLMAMMSVSRDGKFQCVDINAANVAWYARAFPGVGEAEWKSMDIETLLRKHADYSEAEVAAALGNHRAAVRTGKPVTAVSDFRTTGERLYREAVFTPLTDSSGRVTHLFYRATDITQLRRAEERLREILDRTPALVAIFGSDDGRFRYVNEAWSRITGYSASDAPDVDVLQLGIWSSDRSRRTAMAPATAQGGTIQFERSLTTRDGRRLRLLFSVLPTEYEGQPCILATGIDITELTEAREQALAMRAHFERIFRLIPEPVSLSTMDEGRMIEVNDAWLQFYGLQAKEVLGRSASELKLWVDEGARASLIARVRKGERVTGMEARFRTSNGIAHGVISAERISWKGESALLASTRDVTTLERARRAALEESRHFTKIFQASPLPLAIVIGEDGKLVEVNEAWVAFFGIARDEAVGRAVETLGLFEAGADREQLVGAVERGENVRNRPCRLRRRSGEIAEALISVERMEWYGAAARLSVVQDVTELRRSNDEIRHLNDSLEAKVKARTAELELAVQEMESFSYSVSHDLRAPLRHIAGFTRMLIDDAHVSPGSEAARYAERASMAATKLGTLIDELLDYSRLGRRELTLVDTDLSRTVSSILADIDDSLAGRTVAWDVGAMPIVRADPTLIRLVMQNLIENAVKYTGKRDAARIEVGAKREDGADTIWVRDNGVGFDMQYSGKLFGVFQRMHTDAEFEGTGIGLANAKRIVERHGGRIWFDAAPDAGATFYFSLPR